jgi:hypothetical protein
LQLLFHFTPVHATYQKFFRQLTPGQEIARPVCQAPDLAGVGQRFTQRQVEVQPHAQLRVVRGFIHGVVSCAGVNHEACTGNASGAKRIDDGVVDALGDAKIISVDDQRFQNNLRMNLLA